MTLNSLVKWCYDDFLATGEGTIEKISELQVRIEPTTSVTDQDFSLFSGWSILPALQRS